MEAFRKLAIHLHPDVLGRLAMESRLALKKVPRRGLEIGGILLGRKETVDETTTFWIEEFQPVESDHRSGPSYLLSEADFGHLKAVLVKNGPKSIGIYRSQTRSERLAAQQPDVELFDRCFDSDDAVFLMLGPAPGIAGFFIRVNGDLKCIHEFALASSPCPPVVRTSAHAPNRSAHADRPLASPRKEQEPSQRAAATRSGARLAAVIATVVLAVSGFSNFPRRLPASARQSTETIRLDVERAGASLRLLWDRNSSAMRGATHAVLRIQDGEHQTNRDLGPSEFSAGSATYIPKSSEVTFRLDVYSVKPSATGSIVAINLTNRY